jgi:serine/threonine-protein kinase
MSREPDATTEEGAVRPQPTEDKATSGPSETEASPRQDTGDPHAARPLPTQDASDADATEPLGVSDGWDKLPPPVFEPGRVVFGKYRLVEKIGIGGMGEVWKVQNVELDRTSALKLIKPEIAQNDKGWTRFQREARLMAKLNHPGAVAVYDFRRTHSMGYIEMEFIRGRSLEQVLKENAGRPLALDRVARILDQLCAVLQQAHGHRDEETGKPKPIVHRDLKPSNLMLLERGGPQPDGEVQLKVLDFGIAKMIEDDGGEELTGVHDIVGTPAYMSPEQIRGGLEGGDDKQEIDARTDIYSTGVVLYHLLTGALPFRGNKMTLLASHLNTKPMEVKEANPSAEISPAVERVVMQCLEKDPARRPQTAGELAEAFRQAVGAAAGPARATATAPRPQALPWPKVAAAVAVLALGAGVLIPVVGMLRRPPAGSGEIKETTVSVETKEAANAPIAAPEVHGSRTKLESTKKPAETAPAAPAKPAWMPSGFVADTSAVDAVSGLAKRIKREDGTVFQLYGDGKYLPVGYRPELSEKVGGQWPSALVRESDGARFVWIDGGVFRRGDPRPGTQPAADARGNSLKPHFVRVRGFYIQDREVTNGEIQRYRDTHPEDEKLLADWRQWYDSFRDEFKLPEDKASRLPAVSVSYRAARKYAASVGGLLSTEAQWEYAAKSRQDDRLFAWGNELPTARERLANLDNPQSGPAQAGTYPKDITEQGARDMTGNVRELCADAYKPYDDLDLGTNSRERPLVDHREAPVLDSAGSDKVKVVVRGGSFFLDRPQKAFTFMRDQVGVDEAPNYVGFRVVLECPSRYEELADGGDSTP